ncbi:hypothetical protein THYS13_07610 [Thermoanaerobacter sp. YS13]|uniref:hypothetical protein n=1 Tax=Thermoanaerobacter sp. YS13 TaxID=1511746 RepID=UPI000574FC09|nr:hypothetical protein [Thermoanaerobacter sp. YS13]KHO62698.1 hypothetical protein THYS13_07610 [Thermoanaerobacter sp. YS13]
MTIKMTMTIKSKKPMRIAWARYRVLESRTGEYPPFTCGEIAFRYFRLISISGGKWLWEAYGYKPEDGERYNLLKFDARKCPEDAVPLAFHDVEIYSYNPVEYVKTKPEWVVIDVSKFIATSRENSA